MPKPALIFTPADVSPQAKAYLEMHLMQEDYKSYWCDIDTILDLIAQGEFTGVKLALKFNFNKKRYGLADIPPLWWKVMAFPPKVERAMKKFWKANPTGRIEWKW